MDDVIRWEVQDRYVNRVYLTQERWEHIVDPTNHAELLDCEEHLKEAIRQGARKQDALNPHKYRYTKAFDDLSSDNTHLVVIVLFRFREDAGEVKPNNYVVTAYQVEIG